MRSSCGLFVTALLATLPGGLGAQCAIDVVEAGIQAYRDLELEPAAELLNSALDANGRDSAPCATVNARALTFLGSVHSLANRPDSAVTAFRRAVIRAPRFRPDVMEFPPSITDIFDQVRRDTPAIAVTAPSQIELGPGGDDALELLLTASTEHWVSATVQTPTGLPVRTLFQGRVSSGAVGTEVAWDGRTTAGDPVPSGWYDLTVVSMDGQSLPLRKVVIPLTIESDAPPLLEEPDSLNETAAGLRAASEGRVWKAIATGGGALVASGLVVALPLVVNDAPSAWARYPVAGTIGVVGIVGVLQRLAAGRPDRDALARVAAREAERARAREAAASPTLLIRAGYERRSELRPEASTSGGEGAVEAASVEATTIEPAAVGDVR